MAETRKIKDPFTGQQAEISARLIDRLQGRYAVGPTLPNGEPEFGWREFEVPPIQKEAAATISRLKAEVERLEINREVVTLDMVAIIEERDGLRKALEPFVELAAYFDEVNLSAGEQPWRDSDIATGVKVGQLRAARAATPRDTDAVR